MPPARLGYVILYVPALEPTLAFYEKVFGLERRFVHESGTYAELETGATALAFAQEDASASGPIFRKNRPDEQPAGAEIALVVDDVPPVYAAALEAGAESILEPVRKPWGQVVSYIRDPDGFLVEICTAVGA